MRGGSFVHRFGPFELDPASGRLFRGTSRVPLSDSQSAILCHLIVKAGQVVPKAALAEAGWGSVAVTENSLKQCVSRLRKTLQTAEDGTGYIETIPNRGYRFTGLVERGERHDPGPPDEELAPYRAFAQGRADLYTLDREHLHRARDGFEHAIALAPGYAPAHIGLANACALTFEATRMDARCDLESLRSAVNHARRGTVLAPRSGEAWIALAFAQYLHGDIEAATAAACKAIALEPDNSRHLLRVAYINWGEERVRAARSVLALCPGQALAHWLIATVLIARGAFDAALLILADGCREQDEQIPATGSFPAVGLHLLRGLVLAAQQRLDDATAAFMSELSFVDGGQLYARECAANTWYALGAIQLRQRRHHEAESAFRRALDVAPAHFRAAAALGQSVQPPPTGDPRGSEAALARAIGLVRAGRHTDAAAVYREVIAAAPLSAGWNLPVEPLINAAAHPETWHGVLAMVRRRAV